MSAAARPRAEVVYGQEDISLLLDPILVRGKVIDYLGGKADEVELQVEDRTGQIRTSVYWPKKGDDLRVNLGWVDGALYEAGYFNLDEAQVDGPPWTVTVRGLSRSIKRTLKQTNHRGFDNAKLSDIALKVAADLGMSAELDLQDIVLERATQHGETDLAFLHRLSWKYGAVLKVTSDQSLRITSLASLLDRDAMALIGPGDIKHLSLRSKTDTAPRSAVVRHFNPNDKAYIGQLTKPRARQILLNKPFPAYVNMGDISRSWIGADKAGSQDVLKLMERVENLAQGDLRAQVALLHTQMGQLEGNLTLLWHPELRAGANVYLEDCGAAVDGMYIINRAEHSFGADGYETQLDIAANPRNSAKPSKLKKINAGKGK